MSQIRSAAPLGRRGPGRAGQWTAALLVAALYVLHQDFWFWRTATPLVFGFLPIGLFYHAAYTVATAGILWIVVRLAWPSHLERE